MWVAQITEPLDAQDETSAVHRRMRILANRFPQYQFSVMMSSKPFVICKPVDDTIMMPGDEGQEREILQFIIGALIDDIIDEE